MAREMHRLDALTVKRLDKRGLHADGGGLYLQISQFDTKAWIFRFTMSGRSRQMGLGPLHTVTLAEARQEAELCRKLVRSGIDPIEQRKLEKSKALVSAIKVMTFKECGERYLNAHDAAWTNFKHAAQWRSTLSTYVYPIFGDLPVQEVDTGLVLRVLEPIWSTKTETASRIRGRIESILDWASARGHRSGENPARWRGHLDKLMPAKTKVQKVKHHEALPFDEIGAFMAELRERTAVSARGLEFLIFTAGRTSEITNATWDEIDLNKKTWIIGGSRMKLKKEHRVPLSDDAINLLNKMSELKQSEYIFPGSKKNSPLSNMAFLQLLKRMNRHEYTGHGFRSTFRDWAAECTSYQSEVVEMALAHAIGNKVEAAYRRGDLFEKRRHLMNDWAKYCRSSSVEGNRNVIRLENNV